MEFRFNLQPLFTKPIEKINYNLLPKTFRGDRRAALDATARYSEIINTLGELSAKSQGLARPVTTAQKLRQSENQSVYILADPESGKNGEVIGFIKMGKKTLYVFDATGNTVPVECNCLLDFFVCDTKQRQGHGKRMFETVIQEEGINPIKMAIDRPSEKLMGFMNKHYSLNRVIPQVNNFVVFEGFFEEPERNTGIQKNGLHITSSPNTALFGPQYVSEDKQKVRQAPSSPVVPQITGAPLGRYAAPRPVCSMAEIIHNTAKASLREQQPSRELRWSISNFPNEQSCTEYTNLSSTGSRGIIFSPSEEQPDSNHNSSPIEGNGDSTSANNVELEIEYNDGAPEPPIDSQAVAIDDNQLNTIDADNNTATNGEEDVKDNIVLERIPKPVQVNKVHTGLKNISSGVGAAVAPSDKMEFERTSGAMAPGMISGGRGYDNSDAESHVSSEGYTDQGYLDLKFYHNRLW